MIYKDIFQIINTEAGRYLLGIKDKEPIIKLSPNSVHQLLGYEKDKAVIKGKFWCGAPYVLNIFQPILDKIRIAKEELKYRQYISDNPYKTFLHFSDLSPFEYSRYLPQVLLASFSVGGGDGWTQCNHATYATAQNGTGNLSSNSTNGSTTFIAPGQAESGGTFYVGHIYFPTDTSSIGADSTITAGGNSLNFWPEGVRSTDGGNLDIVVTTQASNTALVNSDFTQVGSTVQGTVAFTSLTAAQINTTTLNSTGDGNISKTGFTKFGQRSSRDTSATAPSVGNVSDTNPGTSCSENATSGQRPYLTIFYSLPTGGIPFIGV